MIIDILKAFLIGICASAPVGPIAILVIQISLSKGHKAGFVTGLGACLVDTVFSIIAIFALALAQRIIEEHRVVILLAGGLIVTVVGWRMAVSNPFRKVKAGPETRSISLKDFFQALAMGFYSDLSVLLLHFPLVFILIILIYEEVFFHTLFKLTPYLACFNDIVGHGMLRTCTRRTFAVKKNFHA